MSKSAISVVTATYKRGELLRRAVNSVLKQTYRNFEIVVVDDDPEGSGLEYLPMDAHVRYFRNEENLGQRFGDMAVLKVGIGHARGDFFMYLTDDNWLYPDDLFAKQIAVFDKHPNVGMVVGAMGRCYNGMNVNLPGPAYALDNTVTFECARMDNDFSRYWWRGNFPDGLQTGAEFLETFNRDPANRNIDVGGVLWRRDCWPAPAVWKRGSSVRWQGGYLLFSGGATQGDVWYLDEPCLLTGMSPNPLDQASFRGTQLDHLIDCLESVEAGFAAADMAVWELVYIHMKQAVWRMFYKRLYGSGPTGGPLVADADWPLIHKKYNIDGGRL